MSLRSLCSMHAVLLRQQVVTSDAAMSTRKDWTIGPWKRDTCRIQPVNASERVEFKRRGQVVTHKSYFDHDPEIDEEWRLEYDGRIFEFRGLKDFDEWGRLICVMWEETTPY